MSNPVIVDFWARLRRGAEMNASVALDPPEIREVLAEHDGRPTALALVAAMGAHHSCSACDAARASLREYLTDRSAPETT